jgi:hypothetical protein
MKIDKNIVLADYSRGSSNERMEISKIFLMEEL